MKEFVEINIDKLLALSTRLSTTELKMLLFVVCQLSMNNTEVFFNNAEMRRTLSSWGFKKTPERVVSILSSLAKKGVLKREVQGAYSIVEKLYLL